MAESKNPPVSHQESGAESPLQVFRSEIQHLVDDEHVLGETGHFKPIEEESSFDAQELDDVDRMFYEKFKKKELGAKDIEERRNILLQNNGKISQKLLLGYIANKIQNRLMDER